MVSSEITGLMLC